jgi:hypothetical protein
LAVATGKYCNNYQAEAAALVQAAIALREHIAVARDKVVIFTDALSVMTAVKSQHSSDLSDLIDQLESLNKGYQKVVIQWVPAHCGIRGNEMADKLAKKGGGLPQTDTGLPYEAAKSYISGCLSLKWEKEHPSHQKGDAYHLLPRHAQVAILRLRTGHNRLRYHMFHRFKKGVNGLCTCGTAPMTAEHILQECPSYDSERAATWGQTVTLQDKLYGTADNLWRTIGFIKATGISV